MELKRTMSLRIQGGRVEPMGKRTFMCLFFSENLKVLTCFKRYYPLWVCCPYVVAAVIVIVSSSGFTDGFRKKIAVVGKKIFITNQVG